MAVSTIPKQLILGLTQSNVQTNANGFIRLDTYGITSASTFPLQAFAQSDSYPNGLIVELLVTGGSNAVYWLYVKDNNGAAVKNASVNIFLRYSTV